MGVKAENRFQKHLAGQITREQEARAGRMFDKLVHESEKLEKKLIQQQEQIETLTAELERAKEAYNRRVAELHILKDDLDQTNRSSDWWHEQSMGFLRAFQALEKKHNKLSAIVRLGIRPERYHELQKEIEAEYPEFASEMDHE